MSENAATEEDRAAEIVPPIVPRAPWRVSAARLVEHGLLAVEFVDGTGGSVDMRPLLESDRVIGTVFEPLRDPAIFAQASVHLGAVEWPGEVDLAPDAMYEAIRASGEWILR